jgi:hypothetical protein
VSDVEKGCVAPVSSPATQPFPFLGCFTRDKSICVQIDTLLAGWATDLTTAKKRSMPRYLWLSSKMA